MRNALPFLLLLATAGFGCDGNEPKATPTQSGGAAGARAQAGAGNGAAAGSPAAGNSAGSTNAGAATGGSAAQEPFMTDNLLVNGDAESGLSGWSPVSASSAVATEKYGTDTYPTAADAGPPSRGTSFFYGGSGAAADAHQLVDLTPFADHIDAGARFGLSAYLGGYAGQDDRASVVLQLRAADGTHLGTQTLGGPDAAERIGTTALLANSLDGKLPSATRSIDVHLVMTRASGTGDDGYADDLVLRLHD